MARDGKADVHSVGSTNDGVSRLEVIEGSRRATAEHEGGPAPDRGEESGSGGHHGGRCAAARDDALADLRFAHEAADGATDTARECGGTADVCGSDGRKRRGGSGRGQLRAGARRGRCRAPSRRRRPRRPADAEDPGGAGSNAVRLGQGGPVVVFVATQPPANAAPRSGRQSGGRETVQRLPDLLHPRRVPTVAPTTSARGRRPRPRFNQRAGRRPARKCAAAAGCRHICPASST